MAQADVDGLEAVDVDEEHGDPAFAPSRGLEPSLQPIEEHRAVREPRERVVAKHVEKPFLRPPLVGDVERHADRAADGAAGVAQGLDVGGEGAPSPLHLEVHRFAHEGAAVGGDGQELGVVGREVLEEAAAGLLTGPEIEALEARAQAGSEPQVGVG